ncbi:MAG: ASCH domain-containing protein [Polyangiaceae bacterium]|nr:ASCH domain-containing protein [Polyangiaceae bacterium]
MTDLRSMRALTIMQPWAWAICHANKRVENRTWQPPRELLGRRIAIHAGKRDDAAAVQWMRDELDIDPPAALPRGAIVATATLSGVVAVKRHVVTYVGDVDPAMVDSPWFSGPFGWVLDDVRVLADPVSCRGAQGLWTMPPNMARAVEAQPQ